MATFPKTAICAILLSLFFVIGFSSHHVYAAELGNSKCANPKYSAQDITDAINNSRLNDKLKGTSCSLGGLGMFESGGRTNIYNGSCCTGVLQMSKSNIKSYAGMSPSDYSCLSLQDQVNYWSDLTNDGYNTSTVQQLSTMDTFDGQKVDASFIASCIQLGTGNCQKMLDAGTCSGFSDSNGITICDMAKNARANAAANCSDTKCNINDITPAAPGTNDSTQQINSFG